MYLELAYNWLGFLTALTNAQWWEIFDLILIWLKYLFSIWGGGEEKQNKTPKQRQIIQIQNNEQQQPSFLPETENTFTEKFRRETRREEGRDGEVEIQLNLPQLKLPLSSWSSLNFGFICIFRKWRSALKHTSMSTLAEGCKVRQKKGKMPTSKPPPTSNLTLRKKKCFSLLSLSIPCQIRSKKKRKFLFLLSSQSKRISGELYHKPL